MRIKRRTSPPCARFGMKWWKAETPSRRPKHWTNLRASVFFGEQSYCGVAEDTETGELLGLYILHPNNVGRCGHICNASYAVRAAARGKGAGELLVRDCIVQARQLGFRILQFNAVVKTNTAARRLYQKLGFAELGEIPGGFHMPDGRYESIIPYYLPLTGEKSR